MDAEGVTDPSSPSGFDLLAHTPNRKHLKCGRFLRHLAGLDRMYSYTRSRRYFGVLAATCGFSAVALLTTIPYGLLVIGIIAGIVTWYLYQGFIPEREEKIAAKVFGIPAVVMLAVRSQLPRPYYEKLIDNLNVEYQTTCKDRTKSAQEAMEMAVDKVMDALNNELRMHKKDRYGIEISYTFDSLE